jgi:hypothetical protein
MAKYKRNQDNISSKIQNEIIMVNVQQGTYFALNPVGTRIWELIKSPQSIDAICERLLAEYDIEPENCRAEVEAFIQQCVQLKVVDEQ